MSSDRFAEEFKALGTTTLLDLALFLPQSFEDNIICKTPKNQKNCVVSFTPKSKKRNGSMLHIDGWCETWQMPLRCNIFNAKPYHNAIFKLDTPLYVAGKCEFGYSRWQITQPRVVKNIGTITPKYKSDLKNQDVIRLVEEFLSVERLVLCGLKKDDATLLHSLHVQPFDESIYEQKILPLLKKVEILNYLQKLSVKKVQHKTKIRLNGEVQNFINSLPFQLTNDQLKAVWDIKKDFVGEFASKRIVMGDVGCGKTMVILCAFMLCYPNRGVLLAPTTILATQLFEEAKRYLPLHVQLAFVSSSAKIGDINSANVIIGTHALLYEKLENVSLVMVDEQHRFGTAQRNALRNFGDNPHFLQFSATPIPRTLGMINTTLVDYSFIKELPFEKNIQTKVIHKEDFSHLLNHIKIQIEQNHQIAIIYPKVEHSDSNEYQSLQEARGFWESRFSGVFVTHGKDKDKEEVLKEFAKSGNILLATTVVEVGISLPRLTVVIIVGAERLGLATLHQLRGRVSRNGLDGYCYLFTYKKEVKRLNEFSKTLDGFEIAQMDLKYRQSGDLLSGEAQSGVEFRWFDMGEDVEILEEVQNEGIKPPIFLI